MATTDITDDSSPAGSLKFLDYYHPSLKDGTYQLQLEQSLSASGAEITKTNLTQEFTVAGPRFTLAAAEVQAQFPPKGASSQFAEALPHVVLNKRLLPWERGVPQLSAATPWLALLVFEEGELLGDAAGGNYTQTLTVDALLKRGQNTNARVPDLTTVKLSVDELASSCSVITISSSTFAQLVPTARELPYLAHVRQVDPSGKRVVDQPHAGLFSVVVANRFPLAGGATYGAKSIVHLVSLEGFGDLLGGKAPVQPPQAQVMLVSLYNWTFSCLAEPSQTFSGLAQNLAYDATGALRPKDSLLLRLPFTPTSATDPATQAAQRRLTSGYLALGYHAQTGEDGFAWYRSPFTPVVPNAVANVGTFATAAAAMVYDSTTGIFDHSLAAAWQSGHTLALADRTFATTLLRLRQKANAQLDLITAQNNAAPLSTQEAIHDQFAGLVSSGLVQTIQRASTSPTALLPTRGRQRLSTAPASFPTLRTSLAQPDVQAALRAPLTVDDPDTKAVTAWLAQLQLLSGVPFVHLVPNAKMLPQESIRFFYLDPNWIAALTAGALNIGLGSTREVAVQAVLTQQLEQLAAATALAYRASLLNQPVPAAPQGPTAGFLIRSALVAGWPGLAVSGTASGSGIPLLRMEHLAPGVLLALFSGVPDTVTLTKPHEGLEFGVDDLGRVAARTVKDSTLTSTIGPKVFNSQTGENLPTLRQGGQRVLNLNTDPAYPSTATPSSPTDLLGTLAEALGIGTKNLGPADFALQMVKGPEEITFSFNPPARPTP